MHWRDQLRSEVRQALLEARRRPFGPKAPPWQLREIAVAVAPPLSGSQVDPLLNAVNASPFCDAPEGTLMLSGREPHRLGTRDQHAARLIFVLSARPWSPRWPRCDFTPLG